jgi:hypothetical protein
MGMRPEAPLNIDLEINKERQDGEIGTVCRGSTCGRREGEQRVNKGLRVNLNRGESIWVMDFIYLYDIE